MTASSRAVRRARAVGLPLMVWLLVGPAAAQPRLVPPPTTVELGTRRPGQPTNHTVVLRNEGTEAVRLLEVQVSRGVRMAPGPASVPPGSEIALSLSLDTTQIVGDYQGLVLLRTSDPVHPELVLRLAARIVPTVDVVPRPALFAVAQRGSAAEATVEFVNHADAPLEIVGVEHPAGRFTTRLETVEAGRRYRLTLVLNPDGPGGRHTDSILVRTTNPTQPTLTVVANTHLREAVYTFPEEVDMGSLSLEEVSQPSDLTSRLAQTLMVYQPGGTDFQSTFTTDLPFLKLSAERGPLGDRWQATVVLDPSRLAAGPIRGTIQITTNDPKFPTLRVPVTGEIR